MGVPGGGCSSHQSLGSEASPLPQPQRGAEGSGCGFGPGQLWGHGSSPEHSPGATGCDILAWSHGTNPAPGAVAGLCCSSSPSAPHARQGELSAELICQADTGRSLRSRAEPIHLEREHFILSPAFSCLSSHSLTLDNETVIISSLALRLLQIRTLFFNLSFY